MTLTEQPISELLPEGGRAGRLTVKQLRRAGEDLREAAEVVAEHGWTKGKMIDRATGGVCALGALEAVTFRKITRRLPGAWEMAVPSGYDDLESRIYRCENAVIVFAETVHHLCACPRDPAGGPADLVAHYNDAHCPGGATLYNMLRIAAARALVLAETKEARVKELLA